MMQNRTRFWCLPLCLILLVTPLISGCSVIDPDANAGAEAGMTAGAVVGVPAMIAALPVTLPIAFAIDDWSSGAGIVAVPGPSAIVVLSPVLPTGYAGALLGGLLYLPVELATSN